MILPAVSWAQEVNPTETSAPANTRPETRTIAVQDRAISSKLANALADRMPKYSPPREMTEEEKDEWREANTPKNQIVRLPKVVVEAPRPPVFSERDVSTDERLGKLAVDRYLGSLGRSLNKYTIPLFGTSAESLAMAQYREQERLDRMSDNDDTVYILQQAGQGENAEAVKAAGQDMFHRSDYLPQPTALKE